MQGSTGTIPPPQSYTGTLKAQQLQTARFTDKNPAHYEEDHFISLELGGNPVMRRTCGPRCEEPQGLC